MLLIARIALVAVVCLPAGLPAQDAFVPHQLLIRLDPSITDADQREIVRSFGVSVRTHYGLLRMWWVDCPKQWDVLEKGEEIAADSRVAFAHPNYYGRRVGRVSPVIPNDPQFTNCWGLNNTGQVIQGSPGTVDADIDAPEAWCVRTDASSVVIAVIDSGCLRTHADLVGNIWQNPADPVNGVDDDGNGLIDDVNGWDYLGGDNSPDDLDGHGTNVTGVCSMSGDNGIGATGVCWQSSVMVLKDGDAIPQVALSALAMQYAAAHNVAVANFSTGYSASAQATINTAVNALQAAG
ncbi:MAG: S8 family serine peptidase, partial [Planctomycetes bacterium]|nr:S8 family serine peptidase [Planctomycetota bacterium]